MKALWELIVLATALLLAVVLWQPGWFLGPPPPAWVSAPLILSILLGLALGKRRWGLILATWLHEIGHAYATTLVGGIPRRIEVNSDASGVHLGQQAPGVLRNAFVAISGVHGPLAAALLGVALIHAGRPGLVFLSSGLLALIATVSLVRSWYGLLTGLGLLTISAAAFYAPVPFLCLLAAALCGFTYGVGFVASWLEATHAHKGDGSDIDMVRAGARLPLLLVAFFQVAVSSLLLAAGVLILV